jgi:D-amino peptidase
MKILIAADMEGISGVVSWDHVDSSHAEYPRFRRIMTAEVNAAARAAFEAGADEVIIADGHGSGLNILIEELDARACLNSGNSAPYSMVQGIADDVQGVMLIGYHACAGATNAILDHTWTTRVANLWLNGARLGETGLNAALCGYFGAPVIMISGDQAVCAEAKALLGPLEIVTVKRATSRTSAECLPPEVTRKAIEETAIRAVRRLAKGDAPPPYVLPAPIQIVVQFNESDMADRAMRLPEAKRLEDRQVEYVAEDMPTTYTAFRALAALSR